MIRFTLILSFLLFQFPQNQETKHLGTWEGDDGVDIGYLILDKEGYATLKANGEVMGGKSAVIRGIEVYMLFEINYQSAPVEIDFVIYKLADDVEMGRLKGILEFIDDNNMKLALGYTGSRPENFEGEDTIVFIKQP
ncbi:MAG: hypothetical protein HEP71_27525 [Roseivirga sp.]|nr:hypothetical protein [Roseivirga sp.]